MKYRLKYIFIVLCFCCLADFAFPEISMAQTHYKQVKFSTDSVKPSSRYSWSTNLVDWLLFAPNIGVEYDLKSPKEISAPSLYFQFKYRPAKKDFVKEQDFSGNAFGFWSARAEYRWHFRISERKEQRKGLVKPTLWIVDHLTPKETIKRDSGEYRTNEHIVQQRIDSTVTSYKTGNPALFTGRYYIGAFAEYADYQLNTKFDLLDRGHLKDGQAIIAGLSGGYEFPAFSYNNRHFFQFQVGASLGLVYAPHDTYESIVTTTTTTEGEIIEVPSYTKTSSNTFLPFITELRFALNYRNYNISRKYWQPDQEIYDRNIEMNIADSLHQVQLDSILTERDVVLTVHSATGDSAFVEQLTKKDVVAAFKNQTGLNLLYDNFYETEESKFPISGKNLNDNHRIEYRVKRRLRSFGDTEDFMPYTLRFKVELAGRADADSLLANFKDSISNYMEKNGNVRPVIYAEAYDQDSLKSYVSKDSIAAMFSRIWGRTLDTTAIIALRKNTDQGYVTIPFDGIRNKGQYSIDLRFHPQVAMEEEASGNFNVALAGHSDAVEMRNTFIKANNAGMRLRIQRPWTGTETFDRPITAEDIIGALAANGLSGYTTDMIRIYDEVREFGSGYEVNINWGVTIDPMDYTFMVEDSVGKLKAEEDYQKIVRPWNQLGYHRRGSAFANQEPVVLATLGADSLPQIELAQFIKGVNNVDTLKSQGFSFKEYQVDSLLTTQRVRGVRDPKTKKINYEYGYFQNVTTEEEGKWYRAFARVSFHRESSRAVLIPYKVKIVDSLEEVVASDTTAVSDSLGVVADSLRQVIDSVKVTISDSLQVVADSAMNVANEAVSTVVNAAESTAEEAKKEAKKNRKKRWSFRKNSDATTEESEATETETKE